MIPFQVVVFATVASIVTFLIPASAASRTITIAGAGNVVIHGDTGFVE